MEQLERDKKIKVQSFLRDIEPFRRTINCTVQYADLIRFF